MGCIELTLERNPRVPRPIRVEFKVGWIELILDKKPKDPRPCTVELSEGCIVER